MFHWHKQDLQSSPESPHKRLEYTQTVDALRNITYPCKTPSKRQTETNKKKGRYQKSSHQKKASQINLKRKTEEFLERKEQQCQRSQRQQVGNEWKVFIGLGHCQSFRCWGQKLDCWIVWRQWEWRTWRQLVWKWTVMWRQYLRSLYRRDSSMVFLFYYYYFKYLFAICLKVVARSGVFPSADSGTKWLW